MGICSGSSQCGFNVAVVHRAAGNWLRASYPIFPVDIWTWRSRFGPQWHRWGAFGGSALSAISIRWYMDWSSACDSMASLVGRWLRHGNNAIRGTIAAFDLAGVEILSAQYYHSTQTTVILREWYYFRPHRCSIDRHAPRGYCSCWPVGVYSGYLATIQHISSCMVAWRACGWSCWHRTVCAFEPDA